MSWECCITALAKIDPLYLESNQFLDSEKKQVAVLGQVSSGEQLESLPALMGKADVVVMDALDWRVGLAPRADLALCTGYLWVFLWITFSVFPV